ncbi:MAG TPA: hypothetical protein GX390_03555 [Acholeplasmataceae bacterium]|jgi:hypothetical protein|nr:hypothetical protein [Acholeplasmataceae bacterium]
MKKLAYVFIIIGVLLLIGTFIFSIYSENLPPFWKTVGFVLMGYAGLASFTYGYLKAVRLKKK